MKIPPLKIALFVTFGFALLSAPEARAQLKIGTVDVNRVFKSYRKTKEAEARINDAKNAATKELNDRADAYKKAVEEINQINQQLTAPALSAEAKTHKAQERDGKIEKIKIMEREINAFRQTREQELQEQMQRKKDEIVRDITGVALEIAGRKNLDFVFDTSGASINGFSPLLFSPERVDFTAQVSAALAKSAP